jgi:GNAT superfamily N-acetyltransferase
METLSLVRLDKRRFADFERLLSGREFNGCYCALWRRHGPDWEERCKSRPKENLEDARLALAEGAHVGFLALRESDGAFVGWTGSGPKTAFPYMKDRFGSRLGPFEDSLWAVGCVAVAFPHRGVGYGSRIVELVVEEARRSGARAVEACPVEPEHESEAFRGSKALYESLGFVLCGQEAEPCGRTVLRMEKILA